MLAHLGDVATAYALALAARLDGPWPTFPETSPGTSVDELLVVMLAACSVLRDVATAAPTSARAFHAAGRADPDGFLAMMVDELLIHTNDVAGGLGVEFDPPVPLTRWVLDRLFPWWPADADPWSALLWANGRGALPGHPDPASSWVWHCAPVAEWNGHVPRWDEDARSLRGDPPVT